MSILFTTVSTEEEVRQILALQAQNHPSVLTTETIASQGFVTVQHDPDVLLRMNRAYPSVIAKDGDRLAGYCLVMLREFAPEVPILLPMFRMIESLSFEGRPLATERWFVMGQVCVAEGYRGQGVFDGMYQHLRETCRANFDYVITEIAERNARSLRAHERVGFQTIHVFEDKNAGEVWHLVLMVL